MKILKPNKKIIAAFAAGVIITGGAAFATNQYLASDIKYTNDKTVSQALNELYENKKSTSDDTKSITANGIQVLDKYYKNIEVNVLAPSVTFNITNDTTNTSISSTSYSLLAQYKYFKILASGKDSNVNNCNVYGFSLDKNDKVELSINQEYKVLDKDDGYQFEDIVLSSNSKSAIWARSYIKVMLYN